MEAITQQPKSNSQLQQINPNPSMPTSQEMMPMQQVQMQPMMQPMNMMTPMMQMPMMPQIPGCPIGLEYLVGTSDLVVQHTVDALNTVQWDTSTPRLLTYNIMNNYGQRIYLATGQGVRSVMGMKGDPFTILILDFAGRTVLRMDRPYDPSSSWHASGCNCSGRSGGNVKVTCGDGSILGVVTQMPNGTQPLFDVCDNDSNVVAKILGPEGADGCCASNGFSRRIDEFIVHMPNGSVGGQIWKKKVAEYTMSSTFGVTFAAPNLDVRIKALLLAAAYLIDLMWFATGPNYPSRTRNGQYGHQYAEQYGGR